MPLYKIIRIKILSDKKPELIQLLDTKSESKNELDTISVFTEDTNMLSNAYKDSQEHGIKLTINDKAVDSIYEHEYISITACFHWKVTNDNIDNVDKTYLIGTNIITKLNDNIPIVKIESSSESIKYKKLVRDNSKKIFGIRNKDIITIKHLNNNANYHNYLILLNKSKKLTSKFKSSINCLDKDTFKWRSYLGIYHPEKVNPTKSEVYTSLSKDVNVSNTLSIDKSHIKLANIYKCISGVIVENTY